MIFADVVYALWALALAVAGVLWLASATGRKVCGVRVGRPSVLVRDALGRWWLRVLVVLCWVWLGVHLFAR